MDRRIVAAILLIATGFASPGANAADWIVPGTVPTATEALEAMAEGDTVTLRPGTHTFHWRAAKPIGFTIRSERGRDSTIVKFDETL